NRGGFRHAERQGRSERRPMRRPRDGRNQASGPFAGRSAGEVLLRTGCHRHLQIAPDALSPLVGCSARLSARLSALRYAEHTRLWTFTLMGTKERAIPANAILAEALRRAYLEELGRFAPR